MIHTLSKMCIARSIVMALSIAAFIGTGGIVYFIAACVMGVFNSNENEKQRIRWVESVERLERSPCSHDVGEGC